MRRIILLLIGVHMAAVIAAQTYKVKPVQNDPFSIALVQLLNEAPTSFENCKGALLRRTSLMGDDYALTIPFPGSTGAVVRYRDWSKNVYVEFRDPANKKTVTQLVKELQLKVEQALGEQLSDMHHRMSDTSDYFGLYIKDKDGIFAMNMEIMGSSSAEPVYLLGPEREEDREPKQNFVLLKVYGGTPYYSQYITRVAAPDAALDKAIRQMVAAAAADFDSMPARHIDSIAERRKGLDTFHIGTYTVYMNYRGGNYSARFVFPLADDKEAFTTQWEYYHQVLQAALGSEYVYTKYWLQEDPYILYYAHRSNSVLPRIYLEYEKEAGPGGRIVINVQSGYSHPTKRGVDRDDLR